MTLLYALLSYVFGVLAIYANVSSIEASTQKEYTKLRHTGIFLLILCIISFILAIFEYFKV